jgi:hypothetical protein
MTDPRALLSDEAFRKLYNELGPMEMSRRLKISTTGIFKRRRNLERRLKISIHGPRDHQNLSQRPANYPHRIYIKVDTGVILVGSDAHIWPGPMTTAMRAFIKFCKDMKPKAVVLNGDVCDFPRVSRFDPLGWEHQPQVQEEIEAAQDQLHKIEMAAGRGVKKVWTLGNHDQRFEAYLATVAPEYAKLNGVHLKDHFPNWEPCWTFWVNDDVVIAHSYKGGEHAPRNNTLRAGKTHISGHLHSAKVAPFTDYSGTRYGVDSGCLADVDHRAFVNYTRDAPKDWRSGFCVLTFKDGRLLQPELVLKMDEEHVEFRGEVIKV